MVEQLLARAAYPRSLRSLERCAQPFGVSLERLCGRELQRVLRVARLVLLTQASRAGDRVRDHGRTIAPGGVSRFCGAYARRVLVPYNRITMFP